MMGLLLTFFKAWGVGFSGAIMPGPLLTVDIRESYRRGFWTGPLLVLGHALLETGLVVGLMWGLSSIIRLPITKGILGIGGGSMLLWMAWGMLKGEGKNGLDLEAKDGAEPKRMHPVAAGALISLANPYWSLWWAVIGLGMLADSQKFGLIGVAVFLVGHLMADLVWYTGISTTIALGRHKIPPAFFRGLIVVCGIFLIYLALFQFIPDGLRAFKII